MGKKNILISGDIVYNQCIFHGQKPSENKFTRTFCKEFEGNALLLFKIMKKVKNVSGIQLGNKITKNVKDSLRRYSIWKPFPAGKNYVWRAAQIIGYDAAYNNLDESFFQLINSDSSNPQIIAIDDAALYFRFYKALWPHAIQKFDELAEEPIPEWIIIRMSVPVAMGDLWYNISGHLQEKTVLIVSARDIRSKDVLITKGQSWEKTASDLIYELKNNSAIQDLLKCAHLIVTFDMEGALWLNKSTGKCKLIFDPEYLEEDRAKRVAGRLIGNKSCFTAGIINQFCKPNDEIDIPQAIISGLSAMRRLHFIGYGNADNITEPDFPLDQVSLEIKKPSGDFRFYQTDVPFFENTPGSGWTIIDNMQLCNPNYQPLYGRARLLAINGIDCLQNIPYATFGKLLTVDRHEIESLNAIKSLILNYESDKEAVKPLSIGVFGPPGAGKSFGIKQIAKSIYGDKVPVLEFNLSQFPPEQKFLIDAFHQVRDMVLLGTTPFVFWDEFDCKDLFWIQFLLAPMQDANFQEGQLSHPIGKSVFVFAGGTSYTMENFSPSESDPEDKKTAFKMKKGPDFVSRLRGSLNVLGPNRKLRYNPPTKTWIDDDQNPDICFPLRRAILIRGLLKLKKNEKLEIDEGLLNALIKVERYKHGARSLESIVSALKGPEGKIMRRSNLPSDQQLSIHVDPADFKSKLVAHKFKNECIELAPSIHQYYLKLAKPNNWVVKYNMPWEDLPKEIQADNIAAASRIPEVLSLVGLQIVPKTGDEPSIDKQAENCIAQYIDLLAEAEHNLWEQFKRLNGWKYDNVRNDEKKRHNSLISFDKLSEEDKQKDRDAVINYSKIAALANYKIEFE